MACANKPPYGEVIENSGEAETNYGFTGEWTAGTGLINLRARYYDPGTGRFISADTWDGDYLNPITFAKWLYANANPVMNTDPSGNMPTGECGYQGQDCGNWPTTNKNSSTGGSNSYSGNTNHNQSASNNTSTGGNSSSSYPKNDNHYQSSSEYSLRNDSKLSEGQMVTSILTQLGCDVNEKSLASKAEETYDAGGGIANYANVPSAFYAATAASTVAGAAEDMNTGGNTYYPIYVAIIWENTINSLKINRIQLTNDAPKVALTVSNVKITNSNLATNIAGPNQYASYSQTLMVSINMNLSTTSDTTVDISIGAYFGFPKFRDLSVYLPKGYIPPSGSSIIPYKRESLW